MYRYNDLDATIVRERVAQFRGQVQRRLTGELSEDEFRPLRLMNGLYLQLHAYMLRVAIPYGLLSSRQLRTLAHIAEKYDRGYGHFTTRQNIQYNWPKLVDVPDILAELAAVEMHSIQTSGNCIRNISADHFAGVIADEIEDPRPYAEITRQWSTFHPEFSYLPRKFKLAFSGATQDRAAVAFHDIGFRTVKNDRGEVGFAVYVGGGMGRTPMIGKLVREFVEKKHLLTYTEAIMRVYNEFGRRDHLFKSRIKILVHELGLEEFRRLVEDEWAYTKDSALVLTDAEIARVAAFFTPHPYEKITEPVAAFEQAKSENKAFAAWFAHNTHAHKVPGYRIVSISLKKTGIAPGDVTDAQMRAIADLADAYSFGEIRATHEQNLVLADVRQSDLFELWKKLDGQGLASANIGTLQDIICCPGLDYCSLANARSIPIAMEIAEHFDRLDYLYDLGELKIKMSGCINACGHHHVGHIGILGVDKKGEEFYQITLGGSASDDAAIGQIIGPAFSRDAIIPALERLLGYYVTTREEGERFLDTLRRVGIKPFKEHVYANN
ncbi:MAG: nitrite/sulfite reductase [Sphingomonadales bacterium]|nr:nitrite/sulfite reductase [Sphingomonadales bacterium]